MTSTELAPIDALRIQVRSETFREQIALALPGNVTPERFARIAVTALQEKPDLAQCTHDSVLRSLLRCAADGLLPDGRDAAIVKRGDQAVYQPMVGGFQKIAAEHGWTLRGAAVYSADEFTHTDEPPVLTHRQARPGVDRGELVAAYAVARHGDGRREQRVMFKEDIEKRKALATTDKVWAKWPAEMWAKTAVRDLFNDLPLGDRERQQSVMNAAALADGDAAAALYGPDTETPALPAATDASPQVSGLQAGDATQGDDARSGVASPVPGPDFDDEPPMDDEPVATAADAADDELIAVAKQAAMATFPNGRNAGKPIGEVFNAGDRGQNYLVWALGKFDDKPELSTALFAFCRVYLPDAYQAELAKREAQAGQ